MHLLSRTPAALAAVLLLTADARAGLIIEPVFNRVPGSGPADNNFPIYDPGYLVNGVAYFTARHPGDVTTYASGDPRDPFLDAFHVWNNTDYDIDGFTLRLVGTATNTEDPGSVARGPVDAVWGDVDGDGLVGRSDIFGRVAVSADGKEIRFEGGVIPVGGRFTDVHMARSDRPPQLAGIDSSFTGRLAVPEPAAGCVFAAAIALAAVRRRASGYRRGIRSDSVSRSGEM